MDLLLLPTHNKSCMSIRSGPQYFICSLYTSKVSPRYLGIPFVYTCVFILYTQQAPCHIKSILTYLLFSMQVYFTYSLTYLLENVRCLMETGDVVSSNSILYSLLPIVSMFTDRYLLPRWLCLIKRWARNAEGFG